MKAIRRGRRKESPKRTLMREIVAMAVIMGCWKTMTDFQIGLMIKPPLKANTVMELRKKMDLHRPKTKLSKRLKCA